MSLASLVASKIQEGARKAAAVAQSFQGFDAMAADDVYVHSDGLNVKVAAGRTNSSRRGGEAAEQDTQRSHARKKNGGYENYDQDDQHQHHQQVEPDCFSTNPEGLFLVGGRVSSSVTNNAASSTTLNQNRIIAMNADSDHDDRDGDPVLLSFLREEEGEEEEVFSSRERKKNKNRFMEELDDRISKAADIADVETRPITKPTSNNGAGRTDEDGYGQAGLGWFFRSVSLSAKEESSGVVAPLARDRRRDEEKKNPTSINSNEDEEEFVVVTSSAIFGDEERKALAALQQRSSGVGTSTLPPLLVMLYEMARQQPREAFIVFTFLVCIFVYFCIWKVVAEDGPL